MAERIVLVVDDEPNVVHLCQRFLDKAGFSVLTATSASQALAVLNRHHVDLLLIDIRMPGLDGFQLMNLSRQHQPDLAAVVMTGFGSMEIAVTTLREGADGLLLKPFTGDELVQTAERALQESERRREAVRLRALQPLLKITGTLFQERDVERLQSLVVDAISSHMACSNSALYYRQNPLDEYVLVRWQGLALDLRSCQVGSGEGLGSTVATTMWASRDSAESKELREFLISNHLSSLLCVPVEYKSGAVILLAARNEDEPVFRQADMEMFQILARQVGLALENAQLYEELQLHIRQLEQSRQAMVRAERMAAAGRLTASIAHEINNPLQSLHNCLHLAGRNELTLDKRNRYLEMASHELDRLMTTVQRMLDYYRPGARDRQVVDLNTLINKVLLLMEPQLQDANVRIRTNLSENLPLSVAVPNQLQQVFINLILNSMEAMPEGGEVFIKTSALKNGGGQGVEILVEDTGPGIPIEYVDKLFEPFMSTKEHGTGLGLAVSYGIISAHGGNLSLLQNQGKGACFRITIPSGE